MGEVTLKVGAYDAQNCFSGAHASLLIPYSHRQSPDLVRLTPTDQPGDLGRLSRLERVDRHLSLREVLNRADGLPQGCSPDRGDRV